MALRPGGREVVGGGGGTGWDRCRCSLADRKLLFFYKQISCVEKYRKLLGKAPERLTEGDTTGASFFEFFDFFPKIFLG